MKSFCSEDERASATSRPVWGAWIEMVGCCPRVDFLMSRPVWGAWIEIKVK